MMTLYLSRSHRATSKSCELYPRYQDSSQLLRITEVLLTRYICRVKAGHFSMRLRRVPGIGIVCEEERIFVDNSIGEQGRRQ